MLELFSVEQLNESKCLISHHERTFIWLFENYPNNDFLERTLNLIAKLDSKQQLKILNKPVEKSLREGIKIYGLFESESSTPLQIAKETRNSQQRYLLKRAESIAKMKFFLEELEKEIHQLESFSDINNYQITDFFRKLLIGPESYQQAAVEAKTLEKSYLSETVCSTGFNVMNPPTH